MPSTWTLGRTPAYRKTQHMVATFLGAIFPEVDRHGFHVDYDDDFYTFRTPWPLTKSQQAYLDGLQVDDENDYHRILVEPSWKASGKANKASESGIASTVRFSSFAEQRPDTRDAEIVAGPTNELGELPQALEPLEETRYHRSSPSSTGGLVDPPQSQAFEYQLARNQALATPALSTPALSDTAMHERHSRSSSPVSDVAPSTRASDANRIVTDTFTNPTSRSDDFSERDQSSEQELFSMSYHTAREHAIGSTKSSHHATNTPDELASVISDTDDIQSRADSSTGEMTKYRQTAVHYFVEALTSHAHADLFDLYLQATSILSKEKFMRNHIRLLKKLYIRLKPSGVSPSQKLALDLLRSRNRRALISIELWRIFSVPDDMVHDELRLMMQKETPNFSLLNKYLEGLDAAVHPEEANELDHAIDANDEEDGHSSDDESQQSNGDPEEPPTLPKLRAAADLITSGSEFQTFTAELRDFLHLPAPVDPALDASETIAEQGASKIPRSCYSISHSREIISAMSDAFKSFIEHLANSKLSWWPVRQPEDRLKDGWIRVYSEPSKSSHFYDDIPVELATTLFPDLNPQHAQDAYVPRLFRRKAVVLHGRTLMTCLYEHHGLVLHHSGYVHANNPTNQASSTAASTSSPLVQGQAVSGNQDAVTSSSQPPNTPPVSQTATVPTTHSLPAPGTTVDPVLFLSISYNPSQSVARAIKLGLDDRTSIWILQKEYERLRGKWLKGTCITGIKFYRFKSFAYKQKLDMHHIALHKDKERYPEATDPEYPDYNSPWPPEELFPGQEVYHYWQDPEACGTSSSLKHMLPIRLKGPIPSQTRAFGMHIVEHPNFWINFLPYFFLCLFVLIGTGAYMVYWLTIKPEDVQNASVSVMIGIGILTLVMPMWASFLMFKMTVASYGQ